jgi:AbrB family transcriptional regulator (stage V sporulation protein T)
MRATGIVRRIDDLGRIVIPKEIRRTFRIKENAPLEIYTDNEQIIFKQYNPLITLDKHATQYAETLFEHLDCIVFVCDQEEVIAIVGASKKEYVGKKIGEQLFFLMESKKEYVEEKKGTYELVEGIEHTHSYGAIPIEDDGEVHGIIVLLPKNEKDEITDVQMKVAKTAATFMARQMKK